MRRRCVVYVVQTVVVGIESNGETVAGDGLLIVIIVGGKPWKEKEIIESLPIEMPAMTYLWRGL